MKSDRVKSSWPKIVQQSQMEKKMLSLGKTSENGHNLKYFISSQQCEIETVYACPYLMSVLLTAAGSVSTTTGMARLKKQFLKDSNS